MYRYDPKTNSFYSSGGGNSPTFGFDPVSGRFERGFSYKINEKALAESIAQEKLAKKKKVLEDMLNDPEYKKNKSDVERLRKLERFSNNLTTFGLSAADVFQREVDNTLFGLSSAVEEAGNRMRRGDVVAGKNPISSAIGNELVDLAKPWKESFGKDNRDAIKFDKYKEDYNGKQDLETFNKTITPYKGAVDKYSSLVDKFQKEDAKTAATNLRSGKAPTQSGTAEDRALSQLSDKEKLALYQYSVKAGEFDNFFQQKFAGTEIADATGAIFGELAKYYVIAQTLGTNALPGKITSSLSGTKAFAALPKTAQTAVALTGSGLATAGGNILETAVGTYGQDLSPEEKRNNLIADVAVGMAFPVAGAAGKKVKAVFQAADDRRKSLILRAAIDRIVSDDTLKSKYLKELANNGVITKEEAKQLRYVSTAEELSGAIKEVSVKKPGKVDVGNKVITDVFEEEPGVLHLGNIAVADADKGKGLGKAAIKDIFDKNPDAKVIVGEATDESRGFFKKIGARIEPKAGNFSNFELYRDDFFSQPTGAKVDIAKSRKTIDALLKRSYDDVIEQTSKIKGASSFVDAVRGWANTNNVAKTRALEYVRQFDIPKGMEQEVIDGLRGHKVSKAAQSVVDEMRKGLDELFEEIKKVNPNVKYREDFLPQYWEMDSKYKGKSVTIDPKSAKARKMTYEEAIAAGFKPKYDDPRQFIAEYYENMLKAQSGQEFFGWLKDSGVILDAKAAKGKSGLARITAENFPQPVFGDWYADPKTANKLNNMFKNVEWDMLNVPEKATRVGAAISGGVQDIVLSGGIGPVNSFTISNAIKEEMSGLGDVVTGAVTLSPQKIGIGLKRMGSPVESVVTAFTRKGTIKKFAKNAGQIAKMQERGIPFSSSWNIKTSLGDNKWIEKNLGFKGNVKGVWSRLVNEPTFQRLMPNLQLNMFNDIEKALLKDGVDAAKAADIAAENVKNFYGLKDIGKSVTQSQLGKDVTSAVFFAPRYRESMLTFWGKNFKGLYEPLKELAKLDPKAAGKAYAEHSQNISFMIGLGLTYAAFDQFNRKTMGHSMAENPEGKKDKLLIPVGEKVVAIPLLGSVATMPKLAINASTKLLKGDLPGVMKEAQNTLSMPLNTGISVLTNKDYFNRDIYDNENDTGLDKFTKGFSYVLAQNSHPWLKGAIKAMNGDQADAVFEALEAPVSVYDKEQIASGKTYDEFQKAKKGTGIQYLDSQEVAEASKTGDKYGPIVSKMVARLFKENGEEDESVPESQRKAIKNYLSSIGVNPEDAFGEGKLSKESKKAQEDDDLFFLSEEERRLYDASKSNRAVMLKDMGKKLSDYPRLTELLVKYGKIKPNKNYADQVLSTVRKITNQE